jgi:undecaprenyl-diphosphatase
MTFWKITWLIVAHTILSLLLFSGVIILLVFILRKPLKKYKRIDLGIFDRLQARVNPGRNKWMLFITFLGRAEFLIPANLLLIFFFLFVTKQNWFSIRVLTIALSSLVLMFLFKTLFHRKRPLQPLLNAAKGLSFPSGHAIMAVTFYGLLLYIFLGTIDADIWRWIVSGIVVLLIILIGYSRVYLRVHYASDVLAGFIIGFVWLTISLTVLNNLEQFVRNS